MSQKSPIRTSATRGPEQVEELKMCPLIESVKGCQARVVVHCSCVDGGAEDSALFWPRALTCSRTPALSCAYRRSREPVVHWCTNKAATVVQLVAGANTPLLQAN
jgi:hypothetical protein